MTFRSAAAALAAMIDTSSANAGWYAIGASSDVVYHKRVDHTRGSWKEYTYEGVCKTLFQSLEM